MARIRCAHCKATHTRVDEVRTCAAIEAERAAREVAEEWEAGLEYDADAAYERFLENGGVHADRIAWEAQQDELRAFPF